MARLEVERLRVLSQTGSISDIANAAVERLTTRLATAIVAPRGRSRKQESLLPLTSMYFLSDSALPYLTSQDWHDTNGRQSQEQLRRGITISSIPRQVVDIMLKNYCETYRPQYPAVEESDLWRACDSVYKNEQPSDFDIFCVHITLAISVCTTCVMPLAPG